MYTRFSVCRIIGWPICNQCLNLFHKILMSTCTCALVSKFGSTVSWKLSKASFGGRLVILYSLPIIGIRLAYNLWILCKSWLYSKAFKLTFKNVNATTHSFAWLHIQRSHAQQDCFSLEIISSIATWYNATCIFSYSFFIWNRKRGNTDFLWILWRLRTCYTWCVSCTEHPHCLLQMKLLW